MAAAVNILKLFERKTVWKELTSALVIDIVSAKQGKYHWNFMKQSRIYETGKKSNSFLFKAAIRSLLLTINF